MRIALRTSYNDGRSPATAVASAADLVAFEREFDRSVAKFEAELRFTDLCWLAWHALSRTGKTTDPFDRWIDTIDMVEPDEDNSTIVPLESSPPTG